MAETPPDLQAALNRATADPAVQAAARQFMSEPKAHGVNPSFYALQQALAPYLPAGYHGGIDPQGNPTIKKDGLPSWVYPLAAAAIGLTAGAATGAFASTAAATALAGDAGLAASVGAPAATASSILSTAAPIASAATTGGTILDTAKDIGGLLGAASTGRAAGRVAEAGVNQAQDRTAAQIYAAQLAANSNENNFNLTSYRTGLDENTNQNQFALSRNADTRANAATDLSQRQFALNAPGQRAGTAVRGDILSNAQDIAFSGLPNGINVPTISGGLRPSMFSADTRALGADISAQARAGQQAGDTFAPLPSTPTYQRYNESTPTYVTPPAAPQLTPLPQSGKVDTLLNVAGTIGALAPSFADLMKRYGKKAVA